MNAYRAHTDQPCLQLKGVVKRFGNTTAVGGVDLQLAPARILALLGPNGAGKTTTIEMCEGFTAPDEGEISVLGLNPSTDADALRPRIGVMLQGGGGYPGARTGEMLRVVAACALDPLDPEWLLQTLGLADASRTPFKRLSGGQQQRLSLACALVGRPELVFLDEPTAGLDPQARHVVWELIDSLRRDGVAVVLTTHLMDEAEALADEVVILDHGRIVAAGSPGELVRRGAEQQVRFTALPGLDLSTLQATLAGTHRVDETSPGSYLIEGHLSPQLLTTISTWCAGMNVLMTELQVEQRSLEDYFLDLTGREMSYR
ncbi:ABC transporter ATP-binding protein [Rhodococcus jostii]|uniref:ABC transporter ATP-binding protein n=1 Tax=Rhodococcus jostii TaxID=132919 RepID=A0ABU4CLT7_RHOJO|nr:ABC transporter ATP-binding protein [Rhodococcus jostii]MDV6284533.1 ABC transporter ATP-binding protein [Rhodococcus jostii]